MSELEHLLTTVAQQLDDARTKAQLSQGRMAMRAEVAPSTVGHVLRAGDTQLSTLLKLARAADAHIEIRIAWVKP